MVSGAIEQQSESTPSFTPDYSWPGLGLPSLGLLICGNYNLGPFETESLRFYLRFLTCAYRIQDEEKAHVTGLALCGRLFMQRAIIGFIFV